MRETISFSGEFDNESGREHAKELVGLFCQRLSCLENIRLPTMTARVCIVAYRFIDWAYERNLRAINDATFKGNGDHIQILLTTINETAIQVMVADCGGKEIVTLANDVREYADSVDYSLFNGGLLMRATFRWRTC